MKDFFCVFVFFALSIFQTQAQQQLFSTVYYNQLYQTRAADLVESSDHAYFIAGQFNQNGFLMKADSIGNVLWAKQYAAGTTNKFNNLIQCADGGLVMTGVGDDGNALLLKTDMNGDTLWSRMLDFGWYSEAFSVNETHDSGFVFCGYVLASSSVSSMFVARTDKNGSLLWSKLYEIGNNANYAYGVKQTPDSGFLVSGYAANYPPYESRAILMKLSSVGDTIFTAGYFKNINFTNKGSDVVPLDNGCVFAGEYQGEIGITRVDSTGQVIWHQNMYTNFYSTLNAIPSKLKAISGNRYLLVCVSEQFSFGYLIITDSNGVQQIKQMTEMLTTAAQPTFDGGFMVLGNGPIYGVKSNNELLLQEHFSLLKTDSVGNSVSCQVELSPSTLTETLLSVSLTPDISSLGLMKAWEPTISVVSMDTSQGCVSFLGSLSEQQNPGFSIFPNPSDGKMFLKFDHFSEGEVGVIELYNAYGSNVFTSDFAVLDEVRIDATGLHPGMYLAVVHLGTSRMTSVILIQ